MASKSGLRVADEPWEQAAQFRSSTVAPITTENSPSQGNPEMKKAREKRACDVPCLPVMEQAMTPTGSEQTADSLDKSGLACAVPPSVPPSLSIEAKELLGLWAQMDDAGRRDLMAVARGLAAAARR